jgi:hypothetical protein
VRRGWEVRSGGRVVGELFEGAGPFVSSARIAGPNPLLAHCAYVSLDEKNEARIGKLIASAEIDDAVAALSKAGFEVVEIDDPERLDPLLPLDNPRWGDLRG